MDIRGIILSIFTLILIMTQNVFADGSVGQLMIADVVTRAEIEKNIEQEQTGMFSGSDTYRKAAELYKHIITEEEGTLWECPVGSYGEATKVVQCLGYEILNGRCDVCICHSQDGNTYYVRWGQGEETKKSHLAGTHYINQIWAEHGAVINSLSSESEKVQYITNLILTECVTEYDRTYKNSAISDMVSSGVYKGTCVTFSVLFDRLCGLAGIESYIEVGYLSNTLHAWDKVIFKDGSVRYYDLTVYRSGKNKEYLGMSCDSQFYKRYTPLQFTEADGYATGVPQFE